MTHPKQSDPKPANPFLDKIVARFLAAAETMTSAAAVLDGRDHVEAKGLDDLRWAASSVARSMSAVGEIATHFEQALLIPGGNDLDVPTPGLQEGRMRGLVTGALAGSWEARP